MTYIISILGALLSIVLVYVAFQRFKLFVALKTYKEYESRVIRSNDPKDFYKTVDGFIELGYVVFYSSKLLFSKKPYIAILVR